MKQVRSSWEINSPYYHAATYEYPAAFYTSAAGRTYLIHCPIRYDQLDFEDVESGEIVTNISSRKPMDIFHSRLEVSPDNRFLLVKGWVWHPRDVCSLYDIEACLADPTLLDDGIVPTADGFMEQHVGAFISDHEVLLGTVDSDESLPPHNPATWDFYKYPKIIDIRTGMALCFRLSGAQRPDDADHRYTTSPSDRKRSRTSASGS
ncbi:hypothetical protein [Dawidia soli]|uniref:Uncharacterized protein n=1 Tax=Dawidia soli TaxID=2782352 RepID=A0AAP2DEY2_9BACT|nr:hypothetical protein [Dawidia soli]MBT1689470.1 hypothetical protein [Dawidia soli]